jgi:hypothetical protein
VEDVKPSEIISVVLPLGVAFAAIFVVVIVASRKRKTRTDRQLARQSSTSAAAPVFFGDGPVGDSGSSSGE